MRPLRVLYLHMTGAFGGSSRSLFEAIRSMPPGAVEPLFVTQRGSVEPYFARLGQVLCSRGFTKFDHSRASHYRGWRWLVLLRELAYLPSTWLALRRAARSFGRVDLIHVNEFFGVVPLYIARRLFGVPAVVHVRAVMHDDPALRRTRWMRSLLHGEAACLVAIDDTVAASIPAGLPVQVVHTAFTPAAASGDPAALDQRLAALPAARLRLGFVGNLLRSKGILDLIDALRDAVERGLDVMLIIVGDETRPSRGLRARMLQALGLAQDARAELEERIVRYGLASRVHMLGFTDHIARAYKTMDVVCFPSHLDAPGRPVFEAALLGVPSIVAVRRPTPDTLQHGVTGLAIEPHSVPQLTAAIERMAADPAARQRMGAAARALALRHYDAAANSQRLLDVYRRLAATGVSGA